MCLKNIYGGQGETGRFPGIELRLSDMASAPFPTESSG